MKIENKLYDTATVEFSDILNKHFTELGTKMGNKIPKTNIHFASFIKSHYRNSFVVYDTDFDEIKAIIDNLKLNTACGIDGITTRLVKLASINIIPTLVKLFNMSFSQEIFPDVLKKTQVVPVPKVSSPMNLTDFRPISILPVFSKILEKLLYARIMNYLNKYKILNPSQHGFKINDSTELAVTVMYDELLSNLERNKYTCSIFLDLSKAFDTVDHNILLKKLELYGFRGKIYNYLKSYLYNRQQCTKIDNKFSSFLQIKCGVPQGSVLGPLLFLLYVNDLPNASKFKSTLFADDTNLCISHVDMFQLEKDTNIELKKVDNWMICNKLSVNYMKTCFMIISRSAISYDFELEIGENKLQRVKQLKYLGVVLDDRLSWSAHVSFLSTKLSRVIGIMYKLRHYAPYDVLRTVYFSLFHSHLCYSLLNWGRANDSLIHSVEILQNKCIRAALFCPRRTPLNAMYKKFNALKLVDLIEISIGNFRYRYSNNMLPLSFCNYFTEISLVHSHFTRFSAHTEFFLQRPINAIGQKKIRYIGAEKWNNIPVEIRDCEDDNCNPYSLFKRRYKKFLFGQY